MQPNWHNVPIVPMLCCCVYRQCCLYTVSCTKVITRHQHVGSWINIVQKSGCGPTMSAVNTFAGGKVSLGLHYFLFWYSSSFNSLWVYRVFSSHGLSVIVQTHKQKFIPTPSKPSMGNGLHCILWDHTVNHGAAQRFSTNRRELSLYESTIKQ